MGEKSVPADEPFNALTARFPEENLNPISHFYRGELSRSNVWRQKMDVTTNWAIVSTTAIISVTFGRSDVSHMLIPFGVLIVFLLLNIEGRRYRFYDVWRTRARMLEVHFMVPAILHDRKLPQGNWREVLCEDLFTPSYRISYWEAVGRRLYRNYAWIFLILIAAWITKVLLHRDPQESFYDGFGEAALPPWSVLVPVFSLYIFMAIVMIRTYNVRSATGEIRRKDPRGKVWPI